MHTNFARDGDSIINVNHNSDWSGDVILTAEGPGDEEHNFEGRVRGDLFMSLCRQIVAQADEMKAVERAEQGKEECQSCGGKGWRSPDNIYPNDWQSGTGMPDTAMCDNCGGSGSVESQDGDCPACDGKGEIWTPEGPTSASVAECLACDGTGKAKTAPEKIDYAKLATTGCGGKFAALLEKATKEIRAAHNRGEDVQLVCDGKPMLFMPALKKGKSDEK